MPASCLDRASVVALLDDLFQAQNFFVQPPFQLTLETGQPETIRWEIYRGRLVDPTHTRQERDFLSWNAHQLEEGQKSAEPVLSLKWDRARGQIHVVRGLLCHVWEGYDAGGDVILSREATRWVRELVGTVDLATETGDLRERLQDLLFRAVVGTSRLPLTSLEAPLPGFTLGQLGYRAPDRAPHWHERCREIELALRGGRCSDALRWFAAVADPVARVGLLRFLINDTSLSPWTDYIDHLLRFCGAAVAAGLLQPREHVEFLAWTLRQLGRHLTAYDLITFHHRGANYPDALLLDAFLKELLTQCAVQPTAFTSRLVRRGLRQGWLLRRFYEGHLVTDAPTSPGENLRVLPPPHVRVPEEQIHYPHRRRKRLYEDDSLAADEAARAVLAQSWLDLEQPQELRELGLGLFIDRPLSFGKAPGEPDFSPLLSYEAFSRSIARQRLEQLPRFFPDVEGDFVKERLLQIQGLELTGIPVANVARPTTRVVSLVDALKAAEDFVLLRTTRSSGRVLLESLHLALAWEPRLIVAGKEGPDGRPRLMLYDAELRTRLEVSVGGGSAVAVASPPSLCLP